MIAEMIDKQSEILGAQAVGLKVRDASNILLHAPTPHPRERNICPDLLGLRPPDESNVWCLGITISPEERLWHWTDRVGHFPSGFKLVTVGNPASHATRTTPAFDESNGDLPEVITISEPSNLTKIGVKFTEALNEWQGSSERTMVCIHSITALIQYAEFAQVFKFLHSLKTEVEEASAVAHYHMDPTAHEKQTVGKIKQLFDTVVRIDLDDNWHVMTREFEAKGEGAIPTLDELDPHRPVET
jgi:hypothetical protein